MPEGSESEKRKTFLFIPAQILRSTKVSLKNDSGDVTSQETILK